MSASALGPGAQVVWSQSGITSLEPISSVMGLTRPTWRVLGREEIAASNCAPLWEAWCAKCATQPPEMNVAVVSPAQPKLTASVTPLGLSELKTSSAKPELKSRFG